MDLTAKVSLITAIIELILAVYIYTKFKKTQISILFFILIAILGAYQMMEYVICTGGNPNFWGKLAFIFYTWFPPIIFYFIAFIATRKKFHRWLFIPAILMSIYAIFEKNFVGESVCVNGLLIMRNSIINNGYNFIPTALYDLYFFTTVALTVIYAYRAIKQTKIKQRKYIYIIIAASAFLSLFFSALTVVFFPVTGVMYPSLLNRYLTFFIFSAIISLYLEKQYLENQEIKNPE